MSGNEQYSHSMSLRKHPHQQMLPSISDKSTNTIDQEHQRNLSLKRRINQMQGTIKMLEKKYKNNLKEGFQNKIKSFRLQAVIQRKMLKETLENSKRHIEEQQLHQKMRRAQYIRHSEAQRMSSISERLQERRRRVRSLAERQKNDLQEKRKQLEEKSIMQTKQVHDRILDEVRHNDRKKRYLQKLQKQKYERQQSKIKQQVLQKIVSNEDTLNKLKEELSMMVEHNKTAGPFITI